jgi:hypothetical protein
MMDESIAKLNIDHYKKLLTFEIDAAKRESVTRLLAADARPLREAGSFIDPQRKCIGLTAVERLARGGSQRC